MSSSLKNSFAVFTCGAVSEKPLLLQDHGSFTCLFSSKCAIVLASRFKHVIYFGLTFVYGVRIVSNFIFFMCYTSTICQKHYSSLLVCLNTVFENSVDHEYEDWLLAYEIYLTELCVYSKTHTLSITVTMQQVFRLGRMSSKIPFQDCFGNSGSLLFDVNFRSFLLISEKFGDGIEELCICVGVNTPCFLTFLSVFAVFCVLCLLGWV